MMEIINSFAGEIQQEWLNSSNAGNLSANVNISVQNRFNPHLNYKFFMVPALMVMLLTMLCGFLPALNIVSEKEIGTIEQINVTPVSKFTFILAKLIPYWIVGFIVLNICFLLAKCIIWNLACRKSVHIILFFTDFHCFNLRIRLDYFKLFRYYATGDVRHVLLYDYSDSVKRTVHSGRKHA